MIGLFDDPRRVSSVSRSRSFDALVAASPVDVWRTLADLAGLSRWASGVDHSSLLTEPGVGVAAVRRLPVGRDQLRTRLPSRQPER